MAAERPLLGPEIKIKYKRSKKRPTSLVRWGGEQKKYKT